MRTSPAVAVLAVLLALPLSAGVALAGDDENKKKDERDKKEGEGKDDRDKEKDGGDAGLPKSREKILRDLFGADPVARGRAARAAWASTEITEDDWLKLLDLRFATEAEELEAKFFAAKGLFLVGTKKSLPKLGEMLKNQPDQPLADANYLYWAGWAVDTIIMRDTFRPLEERIKSLTPAAQADALLAAWVDQDGSGKENRLRDIPGTPEKAPWWWRSGLAGEVTKLGAEGAFGFARAIRKTDNPWTRADLVAAMDREFFGHGAQATPNLPPAVRNDPRLKEAGMAALRAVMARADDTQSTTADPGDGRGGLQSWALGFPGERIADMDQEIIDFVRARAAKVHETNRDSDQLLGRAFNTLENDCRTDRALDFAVGWNGPWGGGAGGRPEHPELLALRYARRLEGERTDSRWFELTLIGLEKCFGFLGVHLKFPEDSPDWQEWWKKWRTDRAAIATWSVDHAAIKGSVERTLERVKKDTRPDAPERAERLAEVIRDLATVHALIARARSDDEKDCRDDEKRARESSGKEKK